MVSSCSPSRVASALITAFVLTPSLAMPAERESWLRAETENFSLIGNANQLRIVAIGANLERLREAISRTSEGLTLHSPLSTTIFVFKNSVAMAPYNLGEDGQPQLRRTENCTNPVVFICVHICAIEARVQE